MIDISLMLVEDDSSLREPLQRILSRKVARVQSYENPSLALQELDVFKPDIIISDIKMPGMTGLEMVGIVRKTYPNIPVIITSAFSEANYFIEAIDLKIAHFIVKPIDVDKLLGMIETITQDILKDRLIKEQASLLNQYRHVVDLSTNISITDPQGIITYVNDRFCTLTGYSREELIGKPHNIVRHPDMPSQFFKLLWETIQSKKVWQGIIKNCRKDGSVYYVDTTIAPFLNSHGEIIEYISLKVDLSDLIMNRKQLKEQLITDRLTQLPNRISFQQEIQPLALFSIMLIDIDRFKEINFIFGLHFGDAVLIYLGNTIGHLCESNDAKLFRIGSDEFILLRPKDTLSELETFAQKLKAYIQAHPFEYGGVSFDIDFTCGSVLCDQEMSNPIEYADSAMRLARERHELVHRFDPENSKEKEYKENFQWTQKIKDALRDNRITIYYQPIIDMRTHHIDKYECLVRLIEPDGKVISPFFFLEIAKRSKLYREITYTVITLACDTFAPREERFSINLSIEDLMDPETIAFLIDKVNTFHLHDRIIVEVLESEGIDNFDLIQSVFIELKSHGIRISIDDFGSGYSNFSYLINLHIDQLKIDGSLMREIVRNNSSRVLVQSVTMFAHELGIKCVGEFISDKEIYDVAETLGIDFAQGYYFSEPLKVPLPPNSVIHPKK